MSRIISLTCPHCDHEHELEVDYETPDRSVGISGGYYLAATAPENCEECGEKLDHSKLASKLRELESDDAEAEAEAAYERMIDREDQFYYGDPR